MLCHVWDSSAQGKIIQLKLPGASLGINTDKNSGTPKYLHAYSVHPNSQAADFLVGAQEFSGRKSLNYFYLHSVVRKNYILKGQPLLGIVYFIRPESHGQIKLRLSSGRAYETQELLSSAGHPGVGEHHPMNCQGHLTYGCYQVTPSPQGDAGSQQNTSNLVTGCIGEISPEAPPHPVTSKGELSKLNRLLPLIKTHPRCS